jgi:transcriptional regulator with XRE-family HTH domain
MDDLQNTDVGAGAMGDYIDILREQIKQRTPSQNLAAYLQGVLQNRQWSINELAAKLKCTPLHLRAVLSGDLPLEAIGDDFIERLALVLDRDPAVIWAMMGMKPQRRSNAEHMLEKQQEQKQTMVEQWERLVEKRHTDHRLSDDPRRVQQYEAVLRQLESFIARQRAELQIARQLVNDLHRRQAEDRIAVPELEKIIRRLQNATPSDSGLEDEQSIHRFSQSQDDFTP